MQGTRPVKIAKDGAYFGEVGNLPDEIKLLLGIDPFATVKEESIHPSPELAIDGRTEVGLPPEYEREVGVEMGKNDALKRSGCLSAETEGNLLAAHLSTF